MDELSPVGATDADVAGVVLAGSGEETIETAGSSLQVLGCRYPFACKVTLGRQQEFGRT